MIIKPQARGFICTTAHPVGCEKKVLEQIDYVKSKGAIDGAKKVLVVGASTGFGLASRITSAFASEASTIGVYFEKPPLRGRTASAGWYNSAAFSKAAHAAGLYAKNVNGDAFSNEIKEQVLALIKEDLGEIDLLVYSLASPVRKHPETGTLHRSTLKPMGGTYTSKTVDVHSGEVREVSIEPAEGDDVANTVAVMGGEDWQLWIDALKAEGLLSKNFKTVAYSYIGPAITEAVYRQGTIGAAKDHLEATAHKLTEELSDINGSAYVSVNKALVTQASSAIPVIPLYISLLYKVMKPKGLHEGCIEQMQRLFSEALYQENVPVDEKGRIRVDDWEMRADVQEEVAQLWEKITTENLPELGDLDGYKSEFFNLFGFQMDGVDYEEDISEVVEVPGLQE